MLYDPQFTQNQNTQYTCKLIKALSRDMHANSKAIYSDWQNGYGALLATHNNDTYRTHEEAAQRVFTALMAGLEFTSTQRIDRPMGTFDRPRPLRAEARRSGRSLRHIHLALEATNTLAQLIAPENETLQTGYKAAIETSVSLNDPILAGVADLSKRLRVEIMKQKIDYVRQILADEVGPNLGIVPGFNALDGD